MCAETESREKEIETQNASECLVIKTIERIGTPWQMNVIYALTEGEKRFNELKRATGVRSKTITRFRRAGGRGADPGARSSGPTSSSWIPPATSRRGTKPNCSSTRSRRPPYGTTVFLPSMKARTSEETRSGASVGPPWPTPSNSTN